MGSPTFFNNQLTSLKFKIDTRRKPFLKGDTDKDGCHTPFWKNQLRYARNMLRFTLIYSVLHLFYRFIISFLVPVIRSDDPFRALSGSKRSKRVTPAVCEEHFLPVLHIVEAVGYVSGNNRGWQSRQRIRTRRKKAPRRSQRQWRPQRQRPGCGRPVKEATTQSTRN